jgi:hypothetical protein
MRLAVDIEQEEKQIRADNAARAEVRRRQLAFDRPQPAAPSIAAALPEYPTTGPDATDEEKELADLECEEILVVRRRARIEELRGVVARQKRAPRLEAVRTLFAERASRVAEAGGAPVPVATFHSFDELAEQVTSGTFGRVDTATEVQRIVMASAINHDCLALLEEEPELVVEALGENVTRLRSRLQRDNFVLSDLRYAREGRRNPTQAAPAIERAWAPRLATARGAN